MAAIFTLYLSQKIHESLTLDISQRAIFIIVIVFDAEMGNYQPSRSGESEMELSVGGTRYFMQRGGTGWPLARYRVAPPYGSCVS